MFAMIIETLCVWGIGVPLAFAGAMFLNGRPILWLRPL